MKKLVKWNFKWIKIWRIFWIFLGCWYLHDSTKLHEFFFFTKFFGILSELFKFGLACCGSLDFGFRIESIRGHQCHRRLSNLSLFHRFIDFRFFFLLRFILDLHIDISFFSISYSSQAIFSNYFHLNWANFFSRQFRRILISRENPLSKQVYTLVLVGINPIKKRRMTGSGNKWRQLWFIYTSIGLLQLLTQIVSVSNLMWYVILSFTDDFN